MVYTSSILNHADINLHKTADFIRVPVELKKRKGTDIHIYTGKS